MKLCIIANCKNRHLAKGYCRPHYNRQYFGKDIQKPLKEMHNLTDTPLYKVWQGMIQRCENKKHFSYKNYGGRGVKVCDRWRNSFVTFLEDMGERPKGFSIDRINNNGNYEPNNCKWSSPTEQMLNKRLHANNKSGVAGVTWSKACNKWQVHFRGKYYGVFNSLEEAIQYRKTLCL